MPRFTLDMDDKFDQTLISLADGGSKADAIRKAVATYQVLRAQTSDLNLGHRVAISDKDGKVLKEIILP